MACARKAHKVEDNGRAEACSSAPRAACLTALVTSFTHVYSLHDSLLRQPRAGGEAQHFYIFLHFLLPPAILSLVPRPRASPKATYLCYHAPGTRPAAGTGTSTYGGYCSVRRGQARRLSRLRLRPSRAAQKRAAQGKLGGKLGVSGYARLSGLRVGLSSGSLARLTGRRVAAARTARGRRRAGSSRPPPRRRAPPAT